MATITTIESSDLITNSRADLNNNFANLNSDKIETSVIDDDTTLSANSDDKIPTQKAVKAYIDAGGSTTFPDDYVTTSAGAADSGKGVKLNGDGLLDQTFLDTREMGTGADGALSVSAGTTTLSFGSANVLEKNYTSINIEAGATLGFSNPATNGSIAVLRATGNVTIAGTIDLRDMGGAGGGSGSLDGQIGFGNLSITGTTSGKGNAVTVGGAGGSAANPILYSSDGYKISKTIYVAAGSGGGGGNGGTLPAGVGGRGGGGLLIVCGGNLIFTGTINTSGTVGGTNGGNASGGGGGSAGVAVIKYKTLGSSSGTFTATGGAGGEGKTGLSDFGGGGGAGSVIAAGGSGGNDDAVGNNAGGLGAGGGGGGTWESGSRAGGSGGATMSIILLEVFN